MSGPSRMEAQDWVKCLRSSTRARHSGRPVTSDDRDVPQLSAETIRAAVQLMSALYAAALAKGILYANPFSRLELPVIEPRPVEFLESAEAEALYESAARIGPRWRTFIEVGTRVGLQFEELAGLHGHRVDWLRYRLAVAEVMTRSGRAQVLTEVTQVFTALCRSRHRSSRACRPLWPGGSVTRWCSPLPLAARSGTATPEAGSGTRLWRQPGCAVGSRRPRPMSTGLPSATCSSVTTRSTRSAASRRESCGTRPRVG